VAVLREIAGSECSETEDQAEQFSGFEQLVVPSYETPKKPVQKAGNDELQQAS